MVVSGKCVRRIDVIEGSEKAEQRFRFASDEEEWKGSDEPM